MTMAMKFVSVLLKIPKTPPKYVCYVNITRSYNLVSRGQLRSCLRRETCCFKVTVPPLTHIRKIHATEPRRALHPLLLLLLRPVSKIVTILSGRLIRKWWRKLTPEEKKEFWHKIRGKQSAIAALTTFALIVFALYYYDHIVETPLTKRKRFLMFNREAMDQFSELVSAFEIQEHKSFIVPIGHPFHQRVARVANTIIRANRDIPEIGNVPWSLSVIDRPDITNAFCLSNGKMFVFTGILNACTTDDQLAIVMSHEISHVILAHQAENLSKTYLLEAVLLIPSFICWVVFADLWAILSNWITNRIAEILVSLPFSRYLEREADQIGLLLAARACFDVREAPAFWSKMAIIQSSFSPVEWLSTHPTNETRQEDLKRVLPDALQLRSASNCPKLRTYGAPRLFDW